MPRRGKPSTGMAETCPCGSGKPYASCCAPFLTGERLPATAEALMRSRYTAYTRSDFGYLRKTWHPATCPADLENEPGVQWLDLKVETVENGSEQDDRGSVRFTVRGKVNGRAFKLNEISEFTRVGGQWLYLGGQVSD